ncbi:MAG: G/U mismatch-specific DNA glycosylase [Roseiflexaceae bacterium]|nr:G/U mismatch-specific DNA glycosylase [Roseiflexaceae bacterium]
MEPVTARHKDLRDLIAPGLWVLFCGINPGMISGVTGHHFARPGNRFWPALHRSGFTPRQLAPAEERELLDYGLGITNIAPRITAAAAELAAEELRAGGLALVEKVLYFQPAVLAVLGITAYRTAFDLPRAVIGRQERLIGVTRVWVLPNPSGLNAHYTPTTLAAVFSDFRLAVQDVAQRPQQ